MIDPTQRLNDELRAGIKDDSFGTMDLIQLMVGDVIGQGETRTVFSCNIQDEWVVKYEPGPTMHNVIEWEVYHDLADRDNPLTDWLAKPVAISHGGRWQLMERTQQPPPSFTYPDKMPRALRDFHNENFGLDNKNRFVCHDYGSLPLMNDPKGHHLSKVTWRRYSSST